MQNAFRFSFLPVLTLVLTLMAHLAVAGGDPQKWTLRNTSLLPKKVVVITYQPSEEGRNGATTVVLAPKSSRSFNLEVGTKVFLADGAQVDYVMSGSNLAARGDKPFAIVSADAKANRVALP